MKTTKKEIAKKWNALSITKRTELIKEFDPGYFDRHKDSMLEIARKKYEKLSTIQKNAVPTFLGLVEDIPSPKKVVSKKKKKVPSKKVPSVPSKKVPSKKKNNGITKPRPGGICADIWSQFDKFSKKLNSVARKDLVKAVVDLGTFDKGTIGVQYRRWALFNNCYKKVR